MSDSGMEKKKTRSSSTSGSGSRSRSSRSSAGSRSSSSSKNPSKSSSSSQGDGSDPNLHDKSRDFRRNYLVPSGGWLHDLVVGLSDMTGLSDFFVLAIVFVAAWIPLRVMEKGVSLVLGLGFDMTIPLQHHLSGNDKVQDQHAAHLEQYWPIFLMATAFEFACLFLIRPDLFGLVVCLKTTACISIWLVQGVPDGAGSSSSRRNGGGQSSRTAAAAAGSRADCDGSGSGGQAKPMSKDDQNAMYARLKEKGYTDSGVRKAMLNDLNRVPDEKTRQGLYSNWSTAAKKAQEGDKTKFDEYTKKYQDKWAKLEAKKK